MALVHQLTNQIRERIELGEWNAGERLPSLGRLALMFKVSRATMWKAVRICQTEALLSVRPRGFIHVCPSGAFQRDSGKTERKTWEVVKGQIGKEIVSGTFAGKRLPPTGKLALKYGVNFRTLRRALDGLVSEGTLTAEGRGFRASGALVGRYQPTITLIAVGDHDHGLLLKDARTLSVVENFERECQRMSYAQRSEPFNQLSGSSVFETCARIKAMPETSGYIVNIWNPWDDTIWNRWIDLFRFIISRKSPLVVLDQSSNLLFPDDLRRSPIFRVIRIADERAGEMVGDFLFQRGHRKVAYVTPFFGLPWARDRYAGLCKFYERYGGKHSDVELFAKNTLENQTDLALALLDPDEQILRGLFEQSLSKEQVQGKLENLRRIKKLKLAEKIPDAVAIRTLQPFAETLSKVTRGNHDPAMLSEIQHLILHLASTSGLSTYFSAFMKSVATQSRATAWVCSDDKSALVACAVLQKMGKAIPGEIAVLGFDNWSGAYERQLTAYDFDMNGMIRKALLMIADTRLFANTPVFSEIEGYIVERRTTRRI